MRANRIGPLTGAIMGIAACLVFAHASYGRVVEGFESGDPAVTSTGDASSGGSFQGEAPPQGSNQYLITTIVTGDGDGLSPVSGTSAVTNSSLQSFFGFGSGTLLGTQGSGVLIPFTVLAGDTTLTLQYDFLTNEDDSATHNNDFAFEAIFNSSNSVVQSNFSFVSVNNPHVALTLFGPQNPFIFHTGYQTLTLDVSALAPGSYSLGVGVEDRTSTDANSALLLDNMQITAVPEPTTIAFSVAGAVLLVALRSRIKRTS